MLSSFQCPVCVLWWRCGLYRLLPIGMQDILVWSVERFHSILLRVAFDAGPKLYYNHSDLASILQSIPHGGHWVMHTFFSHLASVWQHPCCSVMQPLSLLPLCLPPLCLFLVMHCTICVSEWCIGSSISDHAWCTSHDKLPARWPTALNQWNGSTGVIMEHVWCVGATSACV